MSGLLRQVQTFVTHHGSAALTIAGGVGVIATTILAVKATPKATQLIEKAKKDKGEELTNAEIVQAAWKPYVPAAVVGAGTISCIFGANLLNGRNQAALVSTAAVISSSFKKYKHKLIELYGKETHEKVVDAIAIEEAREVGITADCLGMLTCLTDEEACGDPVLFYDSFENRYFECTFEQVIAAQYHFNRNYVMRGMALLNEFYDFLGLDRTDHGASVGWCVEDEIYWIDFNNRKVVLDDGLEVFIIETAWDPTPEVLEYYW